MQDWTIAYDMLVRMSRSDTRMLLSCAAHPTDSLFCVALLSSTISTFAHSFAKKHAFLRFGRQVQRAVVSAHIRARQCCQDESSCTRVSPQLVRPFDSKDLHFLSLRSFRIQMDRWLDEVERVDGACGWRVRMARVDDADGIFRSSSSCCCS